MTVASSALNSLAAISAQEHSLQRLITVHTRMRSWIITLMTTEMISSPTKRLPTAGNKAAKSTAPPTSAMDRPALTIRTVTAAAAAILSLSLFIAAFPSPMIACAHASLSHPLPLPFLSTFLRSSLLSSTSTLSKTVSMTSTRCSPERKMTQFTQRNTPKRSISADLMAKITSAMV